MWLNIANFPCIRTIGLFSRPPAIYPDACFTTDPPTECMVQILDSCRSYRLEIFPCVLIYVYLIVSDVEHILAWLRVIFTLSLHCLSISLMMASSGFSLCFKLLSFC